MQELKKNIHGSGTTTLIISNEEIKDQKGGFLSILLGTLRAILLWNLLAGKGIIRAGTGKQWDF